MAESLGEKLRLAREARGITLSEVSAQTRIATRYLEAIEDDNYKPLPGGVFNKGFIKAYAKYVGVDETEALSDYARIVDSNTQAEQMEDPHYRRNSVMTDDGRRSSWTSMIFAVIILALMSGGLYALVQWYRSAPAEPPKPTAANTNSNANANSAVANANTAVPVTDKLKVELKANTAAGGQAPSVTVIVDDGKSESAAMSATAKIYEPQNNIKISFSKYQVANVLLTLNGKVITLPSQPLKPTDQAIKFEINKTNAAQILQSGQITLGETAEPTPALPTDANVNANAVTPPTTVATPKPATPKSVTTPSRTPATATNTAATNAPVKAQPTTTVPKPAPSKPPGN